MKITPLFPKSVRKNLTAHATGTQRGPIKDRNELAHLRYMQSLKRKETQ